MMDEGSVEVGGWIEVKLPAYEVVWLEASESMTQSVATGGVKAIVLKELTNDCWSHAHIQGDQAGAAAYGWCGGGASKVMKEGPLGAP
jgi:hypothetical protein